MSYYLESGTGAVSVSPKRHEDEEDKYEDEEECEEGEEGEDEEEEEPHKTKVREFSVRVVIMLFWLVTFHLVSSTIVTCITGLIMNSAKCFGGIIGLAIFVLPVAYAISPERVCSFKFRSLAPTIADGLYKLDYFVKRLVRTIGDKLKLKIKQV